MDDTTNSPEQSGAVATAAPEKSKKKIAIVGFAQSSIGLAPWDDESWEIWTLNNIYNTGKVKRWNRWFELHPDDEFRAYPAFHDQRVDIQASVRGDKRELTSEKIEHIDWLKQQTPDKPIFFQNAQPDIPAARVYPLREIVEWCERHKFIPYFTNSISYMLVMAIAEGCSEIGLWGVDMAVGGEYEKERPSVEYWLGILQGLGIKLTLPVESELLKAKFYGYERLSPAAKHIDKKIQEWRSEQSRMNGEIQRLQCGSHYMAGAADALEQVRKNILNIPQLSST